MFSQYQKILVIQPKRLAPACNLANFAKKSLKKEFSFAETAIASVRFAENRVLVGGGEVVNSIGGAFARYSVPFL